MEQRGQSRELSNVLPSMSMIHLLILAVHLLATIAKLLRPGGVRAVMAESLLLRHQLIIAAAHGGGRRT